jgi:hypothetical protein
MEDRKMPSEEEVKVSKEKLMQEKQLNQPLHPTEWTFNAQNVLVHD